MIIIMIIIIIVVTKSNNKKAKEKKPGKTIKLFFKLKDISAQSIKRLVDLFKKTDSDFLSLAAKVMPTWKDGSTVAIIIYGTE